MKESKRDFIYLIFLIIHLPATALIDSQALFFSKHIFPTAFRKLFELASADDYLLQNALHPNFHWFQSFMLLEFFFQFPVFIFGIKGLLKKDNTSIQPLLAIYGASSSTTTIACLATVILAPTLSTRQKLTLFATYLPFFFVPFAMTIDYGMRLTRVCRAVDEAQSRRKQG